MGMTPREETKSLRVTSVNDQGAIVFVANATYSAKNISVNFEMLDQTYCDSHPQEVHDAISSFMARLNVLLTESNLPIIEPAS